MERKSISTRGWLAIIAATIAGMAMGAVLLGPPGAAALSAAFGRGAYKHCRELTDAR